MNMQEFGFRRVDMKSIRTNVEKTNDRFFFTFLFLYFNKSKFFVSIRDN